MYTHRKYKRIKLNYSNVMSFQALVTPDFNQTDDPSEPKCKNAAKQLGLAFLTGSEMSMKWK